MDSVFRIRNVFLYAINNYPKHRPMFDKQSLLLNFKTV